jgi:two-component system response regulator AtoC
LADIAPTDIPVLLQGESGTGKEVLALEIHRRSRRSHQPFIKVNCAALTQATFRERALLNEGPNGAGGFAGTLFLDEIGELDPALQPKLLHVLPDNSNGTTPTHRKARLICATSRNLEELLRAGRFREELYYRINGVCLRLPPLRHCKKDIPLLVEFFLQKYAGLFGRPLPVLSSRAMRSLTEHPWPGNIRELENTVRKIVALGDEKAVLADLEPQMEELRHENGPAREISLKEAARAASRQAERELILKVLARTRWNRKRAAQELQISYKALLYKLKQIGLEDSTAT